MDELQLKLKVNLKVAIFLMGPTACGKTSLALALAQVLPIEIVNVDSSQVYIGMDVGTSKPTRTELNQTKHHLIDICFPDQPYSVAKFCHDVVAILAEINSRGKIPLLVGGTMLYFYALCYGLSELPAADYRIREDLNLMAHKHGWQYLHAKLSTIDPVAASKIMVNDSQRIQRALEVCMITGQKYSSYLQGKTISFLSDWTIHYFAILHHDRQVLHKEITARFHKMLNQGLIAEVNLLLNQGFDLDLPAMRSVGYRQLMQYLKGSISLELACSQAIASTKQLAKKQYTWLRKWQSLVNLNLLDATSAEKNNLNLIVDKVKC